LATPPTILLKFEAGAVYPYHNHPGGEEVFVLEGDVLFNEEKLSQVIIYILLPVLRIR